MKAAWVQRTICSFLCTLEVWISLAHVHIFLLRWSSSSHNTSNTKYRILRPLPQDALLKFLIILLGNKNLNHYKEKQQEPVPHTAVACKWLLSKRCNWKLGHTPSASASSFGEMCGWMALTAPQSKARHLAVWKAITQKQPPLTYHFCLATLHLLFPHISSSCN